MVRNIADMLSSVMSRTDPDEETAAREFCLVCDEALVDSELYQRHNVCPRCRFHYSFTARERIDTLADPGSFKEINRTVTSLDPLSFSSRTSYRQSVFRDQRRTGLTEAAVTGTCSIGGTTAVLIVLDFGFMGGTMGCVVGEKVALAFEYAARRKQPVVAVVTSGGVRIQEGVLSLMQMAKTAMAANRLAEAGLPFISILANPSTGHAYASFANLADVIVAEPGAIVGLSSMRAVKNSDDEPSPADSHSAESRLHHGMIDAVVDRTQSKDTIAALLDMLMSKYHLTRRDQQEGYVQPPRAASLSAWEAVNLARHPERPTGLDYMSQMVTNFVELHGDRVFGDDEALVWGVGQLGGQTIVVIGQERGDLDDAQQGGRISPEGFRETQRAVRLAAKFDLPIITLIDTPGPHISTDAEVRGLGSAIAVAMAEVARVEVPSIAVIIGEGGSEGALPLAVVDRVLMLENAIYSVISPEDAAALMYQDAARADEAAESLKLTAHDCYELGIVDLIVQEPAGGAHTNPTEAIRHLRRVLLQELSSLQAGSRKRLLRSRYKKFRKMGEYSSHFRTAITREVNSLRGIVSTRVRRMRRSPEPEHDDHDHVADGFSNANGSRHGT